MLRLLGAFILASSWASVPDALANQVAKKELTSVEMDKVLAQSVIQYNRYGTASQWLDDCEKQSLLTKDGIKFLRGEFAKYGSRLDSIKKTGTNLEIGASEHRLLIKFANIGHQIIEINSHQISLEGLEIEQLYGLIKEAIPQVARTQFSFLPQANALVGYVIAGAVVAPFVAYGIYSDMEARKGLAECEKSSADPLFQDPPNGGRAAELMEKQVAKIESYKTWGMKKGYSADTGLINKFNSCLRLLNDQYNKLVPLELQRHQGNAVN